MKRSWSIGFLLLSSTAFAYTQAYVEQKKQECTFKGTVSDVCVEFFTDVIAGQNVLKVSREAESDIRGCFADLNAFSGRAPNCDTVMRKLSSGQEGYKNKYVDECIRVGGVVIGEEWATAAAKKGFYDTINKGLATDFESKCGTRGQLREEGDPPPVVLWAKTKSQAVVWTGTDPAGATLSIRCDGYIVGKTKGGKPINVAPKMIGEIRDGQNKSCIANCQISPSNSVCVEGARRGKVTPLCASYCRDKCR